MRWAAARNSATTRYCRCGPVAAAAAAAASARIPAAAEGSHYFLNTVHVQPFFLKLR